MSRARRPPAAAGAVLALLAAGCGGGGAGAARPAVPAGAAPAPPRAFAWLRPAPPPRGWTAHRLGGGAVLAYPGSWRAQRSDPGAVTGVLPGRRGEILGYLNATPEQGDEALRGWAAFRMTHNRHEGDMDVRRLASAEGLRFRTGHGSCVVDAYRTSVHAYREIACIVAGRSATTVVVGAAPPRAWHSQAPVLERAISAFAT